MGNPPAPATVAGVDVSRLELLDLFDIAQLADHRLQFVHDVSPFAVCSIGQEISLSDSCMWMANRFASSHLSGLGPKINGGVKTSAFWSVEFMIGPCLLSIKPPQTNLIDQPPSTGTTAPVT